MWVKVAVSLYASLSGGVNHAWLGFIRNENAKKNRLTSLSTSGSRSSLAQFPLCFSLLRPKEDLLSLWFLVYESYETQKTHLLLNHP